MLLRRGVHVIRGRKFLLDFGVTATSKKAAAAGSTPEEALQTLCTHLAKEGGLGSCGVRINGEHSRQSRMMD